MTIMEAQAGRDEIHAESGEIHAESDEMYTVSGEIYAGSGEIYAGSEEIHTESDGFDAHAAVHVHGGVSEPMMMEGKEWEERCQRLLEQRQVLEQSYQEVLEAQKRQAESSEAQLREVWARLADLQLVLAQRAGRQQAK